MKIFHCDHCGHLLFFENTACVSCQRAVAYLPDLAVVGSLDREPDAEVSLPGHDAPIDPGTSASQAATPDRARWRSPLPLAAGHSYRLCANYSTWQVCNWAIPTTESDTLCVSCRLTTVIPNVSEPEARSAWYRLEVAKRRLVFTLLELKLPLTIQTGDTSTALTFEFKADSTDPNAPPVITGHAAGVITINIAEADDAERERRRKAVHEPYRTLLGHMRHESGHFYWEHLVNGTAQLEPFRALFGDERRDYGDALRVHYEQGAPPDWQSRFVSAYASAHPWEDWAETWAHYLHMIDTLETAAACGLSLKPRREDEPSLTKVPRPLTQTAVPFEPLIESWFPLTYVLNNLNRGLGLADGYPFVLSTPAIAKLQFVHDIVSAERTPPNLGSQ